LQVFGYLAFAKELGHIGKLDDWSTPGVFIGYAKGSKAYRILDPKTRRVRTARDVFNGGRGWAWDKAVDNGSTSTYDDFTVEHVHFVGAKGVGSSSSPSMPTSAPKSPLTPVSSIIPRSPATTSVAPNPSPTPPQSATPHAPVSTTTPPGTLEMDVIKNNHTWELVDLPHGHRVITLKWVFKLKRDEVGAIVKHKARLVARGFVQQERVDFDDTGWSPCDSSLR